MRKKRGFFENKVGRLTLPNFKTDYEATVIEAVVLAQDEQINGIELRVQKSKKQ